MSETAAYDLVARFLVGTLTLGEFNLELYRLDAEGLSDSFADEVRRLVAEGTSADWSPSAMKLEMARLRYRAALHGLGLSFRSVQEDSLHSGSGATTPDLVIVSTDSRSASISQPADAVLRIPQPNAAA